MNVIPPGETLACAGSLMSGLSDPLKDSPAAVTAKAALKAYPDLMIFLYENAWIEKYRLLRFLSHREKSFRK